MEGAKEDKIFIVQEGEVQLEKSVRMESEIRSVIKKKNVQIKVSILSNGGVIGEELFLNDNYCYYYTCTVLSPKAIILVGDKKSIEVKFPNTIKEIFKNMWENKEKLRQEIIYSRKAELEADAEKYQLAQELRHNLEKAQNFYINNQKSQKQIKLQTQRNYNLNSEDQNAVLRQTPTSSSQNINIKNQNSNNKNSLLSTILDTDGSIQADLSREFQIQKLITNQNSSKNLELSKDSKLQKEEQAKLSQPQNYVYDFGDNEKKQFMVKKQQKVSIFQEKPKIPLQNLDISKKFDQYVKNYKNNFLFSKELNESLLNGSQIKNENNKDLHNSIENLKDSSDSSRILQSIVKSKTQKLDEETNSQEKLNDRRTSKSSYDLTVVERQNHNILKSFSLTRKQKSEKVADQDNFSQRKKSENIEIESQSPIQHQKASQFNSTLGENGFSALYQPQERKTSFQLFKQLSKISDSISPFQIGKSFKSSNDLNSNSKENPYFQQSDLYQLSLPRVSSQNPFIVGKSIDFNRTQNTSQNNLEHIEGLTQKEILFNRQQKSRHQSSTTLKQLNLQDQQLSQQGDQIRKNIMNLSPTSSLAELELACFGQHIDNQSINQLPTKKKQLSFQINFHSQAASPERTSSEQELSEQQTYNRSRKISEHQKSQYFEDHQKEQQNIKSSLKLTKTTVPSIPHLPSFLNKKVGIKTPTASESLSKNIENIFMDIKQKKVIFYNSPKNNVKNPLIEYGNQQKAELIKLNSYYYLDEAHNTIKGGEKVLNQVSNSSPVSNVPFKSPTLHNLRLKQFKVLKESLNQKKSVSLTKLNVTSPRLEMIVNTNKKSFNIKQS